MLLETARVLNGNGERLIEVRCCLSSLYSIAIALVLVGTLTVVTVGDETQERACFEPDEDIF